MLLLGSVSLVTLVFAGAAFAAFTPTRAIGHTPPTPGATATSFRLTVPRDDAALCRWRNLRREADPGAGEPEQRAHSAVCPRHPPVARRRDALAERPGPAERGR